MKNQKASEREIVNVGVDKIEVSEIVMLQATINYTIIYLNNGKQYLSAKTIKSYEDLCEKDSFLRIHRSYIINTEYLTDYSFVNSYVVLSNTIKASISRRCKNQFRMYYSQRKKRIETQRKSQFH
ncbi:LytTR family DNA-binding domain-containing protein [Arcicella sp. DC2W]|uniref:LytTR family DNA-binding domain-containing protein n=1 Tax=Arcicella gelida TaxID=2984195 RepID=A0ABU5RZ97_9BACT|nr:LytTR family DNA-binding domain-containing protein [Arcicella sp. DC2W]MEA5401471.1 LytTR family DNA-binding domain-containing protein [Arcicella sp. DC2W]